MEKMPSYDNLLSGGDLRSIGNSDRIAANIQSQDDFDILFPYLFQPDRLVVMRAADAIEKITVHHPEYLQKHKEHILELCRQAANKELQWHLALLLPRLDAEGQTLEHIWGILEQWARDKTNSRIVRVNSLQGMFEMAKRKREWTLDFISLLTELEQENIPSLSARIKKIRKQIEQTTA